MIKFAFGAKIPFCDLQNRKRDSLSSLDIKCNKSPFVIHSSIMERIFSFTRSFSLSENELGTSELKLESKYEKLHGNYAWINFFNKIGCDTKLGYVSKKIFNGEPFANSPENFDPFNSNRTLINPSKLLSRTKPDSSKQWIAGLTFS